MTAYEITTAEQRARCSEHHHMLITISCTACGDQHRLVLDEEQLDSISWLSAADRRGVPRVDDQVRALSAAPPIVIALVWQLTHTTAHEERARRVEHLRRVMATSDVATWGHVGGKCEPCAAEARGEVADLACDHVIVETIDGDTGITVAVDRVADVGPRVRVVKP